MEAFAMSTQPKTYWMETELYGLLGNPTGKSLSPLIHNLNFRAMGMNAVYYPLEFGDDALSDVMKALPHIKYKGLNVTMPYKKSVIPYLDELDEIGRLCGAVNTIRIDGGKMTGTNTDGTGFVRSLKERAGFDPAGKRITLLGSGGAGRGIAFALLMNGAARLSVCDIPDSREMLSTLVAELNAYKHASTKGVMLGSDEIGSVVAESEAVINATNCGMTPRDASMAIDAGLLENWHVVCDIVYAPPFTKFLGEAKSKGCKVVEGYWMLLWQAVDAFRFWTGRDPDVDVMQRAVLESVVH